MKTIIFFLIMLLHLVWLPAQVTNSGNLQFHSGASIAIKGDFTNNGSLTDSSQVVLLNGCTVQNIHGSMATVFNNLKLTNAAGARLQRNISVTKSLVLETGPFELNSKTLTILNNQTSAISRTNGYIVSENTNNSSILAWQINSVTGSHLIPLGNATGEYIPFTINVTSGNVGLFTLSTYPTATNNTPLPVSPVTVTQLLDPNNNDNSSNVADRFWHLTKSGGGIATLTFTVTATEAGGLNPFVAQRWNETTQGWEIPLPSQTSTATSATVPDVSTFSTWVLVSSNNPLPVELLLFNAKKSNETVLVSWVTASEINSDYFVVEKTTDFIHFSKVAQVDAAGNSNQIINYDITDDQPISGVSYYRLQQTDFSGQTEYSQFVAVNFDQATPISAMIYPIPAASDELNIRLNNFSNGSIQIEINDMLGHCEYNKSFVVDGSNMEFLLPDTDFLSEGIKIIRITSSDGIISQKVLIRSK